MGRVRDLSLRSLLLLAESLCAAGRLPGEVRPNRYVCELSTKSELDLPATKKAPSDRTLGALPVHVD